MIVTAEDLIKRIPGNEFIFSSSRSSGPGGQNVNKVNTKVEVRINIADSTWLSDEEIDMIFAKLGNRIRSGGEIIVTSQSERTQLKNKEKALSRLLQLLSEAMSKDEERVSTRPTAASVSRRLDQKRKRSSIKKTRTGRNHPSEE